MVETNFGMRYAPHRSGGWWQPVDCKLSPAQLDQLLDNPSTDLGTSAGPGPGEAYTVWADEAAEEITFVYRGWHNQSEGSEELEAAGDNHTHLPRSWAEVRLAGGLQIPLRPVPDRPDLWELTLYIKGLAQAVITYEFMPLEEPLTAYTAATAFKRHHQRQQARQNWRHRQGYGHLHQSQNQPPPAQAAPASGVGNSATIPTLATATLTATQHDAVVLYLPPVQQWRGSHSPAVPIKSALSHLQGKLKTYDLPSFVLGELRTITVYTPPPALEPSTALPPRPLAESEGDDDNYNSRPTPTPVPAPTNPLPVIYMSDGSGVAGYACAIEPLMVAGQLPPVVLVGLHSGDSLRGSPTTNTTTTNPALDRRAAEYLPSHTTGPFFDDHTRFFAEEVLPWSVNTLGVSDRREDRAVFGVSNGAAWAIEMGNRYPDLLGAVIAFSLGWDRGFSDSWLQEAGPELQANPVTTGAAPHTQTAPTEAVRGSNAQPGLLPHPRPRYYLEAGTLEDGFRDTTASWARKLARAGISYEHRQLIAGHDYLVWQEEFGRAIAWWQVGK